MSAGAERPIGLVLRTLLAIVGVAALAAAFVVGTAQLRSSSTASLLIAGFCLVIMVGGVLLIRGAVRGRIRFRRVGRRSSMHD